MAPAGSTVQVSVGDAKIDGFDEAALRGAVTLAGYPQQADLAADQQTDDRRADRRC